MGPKVSISNFRGKISSKKAGRKITALSILNKSEIHLHSFIHLSNLWNRPLYLVAAPLSWIVGFCSCNSLKVLNL